MGRVLVCLTLVLRTIVRVTEISVPHLVGESETLRRHTQPRMNKDRPVFGQPEPVRGSKRPVDDIDT